MTNPQREFPGRQPILDKRERLFGYRLRGLSLEAGEPERHLGPRGLPDLTLFVDVAPGEFDHPALARLEAPRHVAMAHGTLDDAADFTRRAGAVRRRSMRVGVTDAAPGSPWLGQLGNVSFARVDVSRLPHSHLARYAAGLKRLGPKLIAGGLHDRAGFKAALDAGFDFFEGYWFLHPETGESRSVAPVYGTVLRTLSLVRAEAALPQIERAILSDPTLAFKLLRYVNSAAFGLRTEIHTPKDAMNMLGYRPMARWLGLALVTAQVDAGVNASLSATAIVRGRMMESLRAGPHDAGDPGDAFMVGLFSVMDALFDMPMERVVETLSPPADVASALLQREGPYGPLLRLVQSCEDATPERTAALAADAGVDAGTLSATHLQALAWQTRLAS